MILLHSVCNYDIIGQSLHHTEGNATILDAHLLTALWANILDTTWNGASF